MPRHVVLASALQRPLAAAAGVLLALAAGCDSRARATAATAAGGPGAPGAAPGPADVGGTLVVAAPGDADALLPPVVQSARGAQVADLVFDRLADPGPALDTFGDRGFTPRLARRWTWAADSLSVAFSLDPRARWHDGRPVRAADVRFTHRLYRDPAVASPAAAQLADVDSVSAPDDTTAVVWFRRRSPEQFFHATYHMHVLPAHLLAGVPAGAVRAAPFARRPVGSGRFRFAGWEPGARIVLAADSANYRGRPRLDRVVFTAAADPGAAVRRLVSGEADFVEVVPPPALGTLAGRADVRTLAYPTLQYGFLLFNGRARPGAGGAHPLFGDRALRRALSMAVNRAAVVRNAFDTLAVLGTGPFVRGTAAGGAGAGVANALPYDTAAAARLLDSLGWRRPAGDPSGVRGRGGRPLRFTVLVPATSASRVALATTLQAELRAAGAQVDIESLDFGAFVARQQARDFDALVGAWAADPSPAAVGHLWGAAGRAPGGGNAGSYAGPAFEAHLDSAGLARDPADARRHYARAHAAIVADAPAVWLYELRNVAGVHRRVRVAGIRPDAWWAGLADWWVPAGERVARDTPGGALATRP
jgi:peptide/nickel transport system substrate-binding protein